MRKAETVGRDMLNQFKKYRDVQKYPSSKSITNSAGPVSRQTAFHDHPAAKVRVSRTGGTGTSAFGIVKPFCSR